MWVAGEGWVWVLVGGLESGCEVTGGRKKEVAATCFLQSVCEK
jgi:hypothetical protein